MYDNINHRVTRWRELPPDEEDLDSGVLTNFHSSYDADDSNDSLISWNSRRDRFESSEVFRKSCYFFATVCLRVPECVLNVFRYSNPPAFTMASRLLRSATMKDDRSAPRKRCPSIYITLSRLGPIAADSRKSSVIPRNRSVWASAPLSGQRNPSSSISVVIVSASSWGIAVRLRFRRQEGGVRGPLGRPRAGSLPAIVVEWHPVAWYTAASAPADSGDGRRPTADGQPRACPCPSHDNGI